MSAERAASELAVAILPLGEISDWQIKLTALILKEVFGVNTIILPATKIPSQYFNVERGRYQGNQILNFLFFRLPANAQRIVGIIEGKLEQNLEENNYEFCFGLADLYQKVALYSVPHLPLQSGRVEKQVEEDLLSICLITHEFAHTLGISHCDQPDCVMNPTQPGITMCAHCRRWADRELKVRPGSAEERFSYAESLFRQKCFTQAIAVYREAICRAPREPLYYHRLGMALYNVGQSDEGTQEMVRAVAFSNDGPDYYFNFGLLHLQQHWQLAESYFDKAIAVAKNPQNMQKLVGQAYREILHDVEQASRHYKEYLRLGGDDQEVVDWLISRSKLDL